MTIGTNIRNKRLQRDLSQNELAKLSGVSKPMISAIERDQRIPTVVVAQKIARTLRCTVDELLSEAS